MKRRSSVPWKGSVGANWGGSAKVSCFQPVGMGQRTLGPEAAASGSLGGWASEANVQLMSRSGAMWYAMRFILSGASWLSNAPVNREPGQLHLLGTVSF